MSDVAISSRFDEHALAELPEAAGFTGELRLRALREFEAMPIPSQETEEWRYTDLSNFELDFTPHVEGMTATQLEQVPAQVFDRARDTVWRARPVDASR